MYLQVPDNVGCCTLPAVDCASIVICIEGSGSLSNRTLDQSIGIKRGTVIFVSANEEAKIDLSSKGMWLFRAQCG